MLARRQGAARARRARQAGALYERRAVPSLHPHCPVAEGRNLRLRRLRQRQGPQIFARRQIADVVGRAPAPTPASSTSCTISAPTPTAGSMSPTARTTASKSSTATANTRRSGTICTGPAGSTWTIPVIRSAISASSARCSRSIATARTSGPRVSIVDNQGKLLSRFGDMHAGTAPTAFLGPHGLSVDSRGDLYVGEVSWTQWPQFYPDTPRPAYIRSLQKYERVH